MGQYSEYLKKRVQKRVQTRGPNVGFCAICRNHAKLSRDHVPPAGCGNINDIELKIAFSIEKCVKTYSQGGSHFKTICTHCNSTLLGSLYDPELVKFHNEVMKYVKAKSQRIQIPEHSTHYIKPHFIAKSIIGHLLAANSIDLVKNGDKHAPHIEKLANYVLDKNALLPDDIDIYFWLYPYNDIRVMKSLGIGSLNWQGTFICNVIKFLPFAFLITDDLPSGINLGQQKLITDKNIQTNTLALFSVNYSTFPQQSFPEYPTDDADHFVLAHDESTIIGTIKKNV